MSYERAVRKMPRERLEQTLIREAGIRGDAELCLFELGYECWREDVLPRVTYPPSLRLLDDRDA